MKSSAGVPPLEERVFQEFKGMNRRSSRLNMDPSFYFDLLNGYLYKDVESGLGFINQRAGCSKLNTVALSGYGTNTQIRTIYEAIWNGGGKDVIIKAGSAWGKWDGVNSFPTLCTGRPDGSVGQCVMFQNNLILADGGIMQQVSPAYAVSALSADPAMPQDSTAVWVHCDKVWANSTANPLYAYYCDTNNATTSTAWSDTGNAGYLDLSTVLPVGDKILGYRTMGGTTNMILVIQTTQFLVLYLAGADPTQFVLLKIIKCDSLSNQAISQIGTDLIYATRKDVTSIFNAYQNNDLEINAISQWIDPYYRDQVAQLTDPTTQMSAVFDNTLNLWYLTLGITNNYQTFVYSVDVQNFVGRYTYPFNIYSWASRQDGTIYSGSDNYVYVMNSGTNDDSTAISFKLAMPYLYLSLPNRYKKIVEFEIFMQATASLTLYLDYWYGLTSLATDKQTKAISITTSASLWNVAPWNTSYWNQQGNQLYNEPGILGRGRGVFIELRHSTLDAVLSIPWFTLRYNIEGRN